MSPPNAYAARHIPVRRLEPKDTDSDGNISRFLQERRSPQEVRDKLVLSVRITTTILVEP